MKRVLLSMISVLFLSMTYAQVPGTLSYQGILVDNANAGAPVADGSHFVKFYFYNDPALEADPANLKYKSEGTGSGNQVTTYKGMFTFIIGSGSIGNDPIPNTIFSTQLYVKVIADGTALTPKIALTTVPYAMNAQNAATAQNATAMDAAGLTGTLAPARIAAGSIDNTHIADGTILAADLNGMGATANQVLLSDGNKWAPASLPVSFSTANNVPRGDGTGLTTSNIFSNGSDITIGISPYAVTPKPKLHLYNLSGTPGLDEALRVTGGGTSVGDGPVINFQSAYGGSTPGAFPDWINAAIGSPYSTSYAGDLTFYTNNGSVQTGSITTPALERMRINYLGNVGIGTSTPNAPLQFANTIVNRKLVLYDVNNNDHQYFGLGINVGTLRYQVDATAANHVFYAGTSTTTSNELMRIMGNGRVGIGTATPSTQGILHVAGGNIAVDGTGAEGIKWVSGNTLQAHMHRFGASGLYVTNAGNSNLTGVFLASGGVTWTSTSDRRLKENILDTSYGLNEILRLSVKEFNFKSTKEKDKKIGFIAQEVYKVIPEIVQKGDEGEYSGSGNADLSKESGFAPWGVDYAGLTPILVKSTQELQKQIEDLKATVEELKLQLTQYKGLSAQVEELKKLINDKSYGGSSNSHAATAGGNNK